MMLKSKMLFISMQSIEVFVVLQGMALQPENWNEA
jgi:hypothetical protein